VKVIVGNYRHVPLIDIAPVTVWCLRPKAKWLSLLRPTLKIQCANNALDAILKKKPAVPPPTLLKAAYSTMISTLEHERCGPRSEGFCWADPAEN
jgi:hypothetical protein